RNVVFHPRPNAAKRTLVSRVQRVTHLLKQESHLLFSLPGLNRPVDEDGLKVHRHLMQVARRTVVHSNPVLLAVDFGHLPHFIEVRENPYSTLIGKVDPEEPPLLNSPLWGFGLFDFFDLELSTSFSQGW